MVDRAKIFLFECDQCGKELEAKDLYGIDWSARLQLYTRLMCWDCHTIHHRAYCWRMDEGAHSPECPMQPEPDDECPVCKK